MTAKISPFLRSSLVATLCVILSWAAIRWLEQFEHSQLEYARTKASATRADEPASDLNDLMQEVEAVEAMTSRWLVVYLPFLTLVAGLVVGATSRRVGHAWPTAVVALMPVVAAAVGLTRTGEGIIRYLPAAYPLVAAALASLLAILSNRRAKAPAAS